MRRSCHIYSCTFALPSRLLQSPDVKETSVDAKEQILLEVALLLIIRKILTLPQSPLLLPNCTFLYEAPVPQQLAVCLTLPAQSFNSAPRLQM